MPTTLSGAVIRRVTLWPQREKPMVCRISQPCAIFSPTSDTLAAGGGVSPSAVYSGSTGAFASWSISAKNASITAADRTAQQKKPFHPSLFMLIPPPPMLPILRKNHSCDTIGVAKGGDCFS